MRGSLRLAQVCSRRAATAANRKSELSAQHGAQLRNPEEQFGNYQMRPKTVTTGLGSMKTAWVRVYSASNRQLGLQNG